MRKLLMITLSMMTVLAFSSRPSAALTSWHGEFFIVSASPGCSSVNVAAGQYGSTNFLPTSDDVAGNLINTYASFQSGNRSVSVRVNNFDDITGVGSITQMIISGEGHFFAKGGSVRNVVQVPAVISASTDNIYLTARLTNFLGGTGCAIVFRANYRRSN